MIPHPMVEYLNSLRTQERGANPTYVHENRAAFLAALRAEHPWFPPEHDLHIATSVDRLVEELAGPASRFDVVLLTGDAGDGKTATCAAVARALDHHAELEEITTARQWTIVKDASELPPDQLEELLRRYHLVREQGSDARLLVAINEGRLRRVAERLYPDGHPFRSAILDPALDPDLSVDGAAALDDAMTAHRVLVLNFRHRAQVRTALPALLEKWTKEPLWETSPACSTCPARERCPMLANARDLRSAAVQSRVGDFLMAATLSGQRLPLRRLQAVLALMTTGGLSCDAVQTGSLAQPSAVLDRLRYRYFEALFRSDARGPVVVQPEAVCLSLRPLDPGNVSDRAFDEQIAVRVRDAVEAAQPLGDVPIGQLELDALRAVAETGEPGNKVDAFSDRLAKLTRSLRRWRATSLTSTSAEIERWRRAVALMESYIGGGDGEDLRKAVVEALNRLHLVDGLKTERITRRQIDAAGFREPVRRALELDLQTEFAVGLVRAPVLPRVNVAPWLEHGASDIFLCASHPNTPDRDVRLLLDARLVHALLGIKEGYQQLGALGAYRRDLARFFAQLVQLVVDAGTPPVLSVLVGNVRFRVGNRQGKLNLQPE